MRGIVVSSSEWGGGPQPSARLSRGSRPCSGWLASAPAPGRSSRAARGAGGVYRARRLGREGRGKPALCPIPLESRDIGELVRGDGRTDLAGDGQEPCHILGREPVIAALRKEEAVAGAAAECVDLV